MFTKATFHTLAQLRKVIPLLLALTAGSLGELCAFSMPSPIVIHIVDTEDAAQATTALTSQAPVLAVTVTSASEGVFGSWWLPALVFGFAALSAGAYQHSRIGFYRKLSLRIREEVLQQSRERRDLDKQSQSLKNVIQKAHDELAEERERADSAEKAKENFVTALSHGVRTPLNAVLGSAELLLHTTLTKEQQEDARSIQEAGGNILTTVNDIFEFYQIESGNVTLMPSGFDLRDGIEEVLSLFAAKAEMMDFDLLYKVDPALPDRISADGYRLKQVLTNLIGSSIKFTEEKDFILVEVKLLEREGEHLKIGVEVKDTGVGIPYEKGMKLFKAPAQIDYSTTNKFGGTGLGLANCEYLVRQMGGTISMEASRRQGTSFVFAFDATLVNQQQNSTVSQSLAGKNILIVDNNPVSAQLLKELLNSWKADAYSLPSGAIALRALSKGHHFDLLLVDYRMPDVDGIEFMQSLKSSPYKVASILLGTPAGNEKELANEMFDAIVRKPIRRRELLAGITGMIERSNKSLSEPNAEASLTVDFAARHPLRILVAEDDKTNQLLTGRVLAKLGFKYDIVENGADAVNAVNARRYDLILMDVQMPELNGMEATARIRQMASKKQPVIIAMTALALSGDREECLRAGMDDYLSKPVQINALLTLLEKWATRESQNKGTGYFRSSN